MFLCVFIYVVCVFEWYNFAHGMCVGVCVWVCVCQACSVMHRVGHLCSRTLDAKRKSNQGAERNRPQGGAQDRQRRMTARIQTETGSREGQ